MNNETNNVTQTNSSSVLSSVGNNTTSSSNELRRLPDNVVKNPKYTENWINIKKISNGIIYNDSNEMISGVKVRPKNIFILDRSGMDNTLIGLMNFYNTIDYEFWLIVADRPVDITVYESELQLLFNKTQDQTIRKMIAQDMEKGDYFVSNNVVDTEYYILFKEKSLDNLQKKVRELITGLASCDLIANQTSTDDLAMVVDNFMNAGASYETGVVMPL